MAQTGRLRQRWDLLLGPNSCTAAVLLISDSGENQQRSKLLPTKWVTKRAFLCSPREAAVRGTQSCSAGKLEFFEVQGKADPELET